MTRRQLAREILLIFAIFVAAFVVTTEAQAAANQDYPVGPFRGSVYGDGLSRQLTLHATAKTIRPGVPARYTQIAVRMGAAAQGRLLLKTLGGPLGFAVLTAWEAANYYVDSDTGQLMAPGDEIPWTDPNYSYWQSSVTTFAYCSVSATGRHPTSAAYYDACMVQLEARPPPTNGQCWGEWSWGPGTTARVAYVTTWWCNNPGSTWQGNMGTYYTQNFTDTTGEAPPWYEPGTPDAPLTAEQIADTHPCAGEFVDTPGCTAFWESVANDSATRNTWDQPSPATSTTPGTGTKTWPEMAAAIQELSEAINRLDGGTPEAGDDEKTQSTTDDRDVVSGIPTAGSSSGSSSSVSMEWPGFCAWATYACDFIDWVKTEADPLDPVELPVIEPELEEWDAGLGAGACPAPAAFSLLGVSMAYSYQPFCDSAWIFRTLILLLSYISAAYIILGLRR